MALRAIQTRYRGCLFRSRLEARWAVFFQTLGIRWQYEPEGFKLSDGSYYLPDFRIWLPRTVVWAEVKPDGMPLDRFHKFTNDLPGEDHAVVLGEIPSPEDVKDETFEGFDFYFGGCGSDNYYRFCSCLYCSAIGLEYNGRSERIGCCDLNNGHKDYNWATDRLLKAYTAARSARFEHEATA